MRHKATRKEPHGVEGHVNVYVLDQESEITSYGKHNRLIVFFDRMSGCVEIREDILHGLPDSTEADRQRVARGYQRMHPKGSKLELLSTFDDESARGRWKCRWYRYAIVRPLRVLG